RRPLERELQFHGLSLFFEILDAQSRAERTRYLLRMRRSRLRPFLPDSTAARASDQTRSLCSGDTGSPENTASSVAIAIEPRGTAPSSCCSSLPATITLVDFP